ncbi:MAG: beta-N-acetylhexosaminidase [Gammaproteobacteria bacterium]|nr:beta-N-acetylhexosaminidase [Gammaproteobacteria bacterium]
MTAHGPVMVDLLGTELTAADRDLLTHPSTGGVILFRRNFVSPQQVYRLVREIHELRSPHLLIAVDQEGGRVQRFQAGFTRLPPAARLQAHFDGDMQAARRAAHELGWLMAAELRAVGVDFSFAPVLDLDYGVSSVIGDRAFAAEPAVVAQLAGAWMMGAREAGMISVGKHFPGHGAVVADSHVDLPIDERVFEQLRSRDIQPFARLIDNGLEAIMPAHVIYRACDARPAGFSAYWLQQVLRGQLGFQGVIFSDDLSMAAAEEAGCFADRARAALEAGCDMVLVCNDQEAAAEVLHELRDYQDPVARSRMARLHGRPATGLDRLHGQKRWTAAVELAARLCAAENLSLNLGDKA